MDPFSAGSDTRSDWTVWVSKQKTKQLIIYVSIGQNGLQKKDIFRKYLAFPVWGVVFISKGAKTCYDPSQALNG